MYQIHHVRISDVTHSTAARGGKPTWHLRTCHGDTYEVAPGSVLADYRLDALTGHVMTLDVNENGKVVRVITEGVTPQWERG